LIVSNFLTLDGYYEYNTELLRDSDTLILSGRTSFLGNKDY
jgi:hypothetical protein